MRGDASRFGVGVRQTEVPGRDAVIPGTAHKRDIATETRKDKEPPKTIAIARGLRQPILDAREAAAIGPTLPHDATETVADGDLRTGDGLCGIERRHPDERGVGTLLEMDGEVGDQCSRADMPDIPATVTQLFAEARAGNFDDMEAGVRQRHTHHLSEARITARNA